MCEHKTKGIIQSCFRICLDCGLLLSRQLYTTEIPFHHKTNPPIIRYSRLTRFKRLVANLRGNHNILCSTMEHIHSNYPCKSAPILRRALKTHVEKDLKFKIVTIWRQLGQNVPHISLEEEQEMIRIFRIIDRPKLSFQIILPILLYSIGRFHDYKPYLKPTSFALRKKTLSEIISYFAKYRTRTSYYIA